MTTSVRIPAPPTERLPPRGFEVVFDTRLKRLGDGILIGGCPLRLVRLSERAQKLVEDDRLVVRDRASALLARRLLDIGVCHPHFDGDRPPSTPVTIIVPVRDRPGKLRRLLESLGTGVPVIVVDDGSTDAPSISSVAEEANALVIRHATSRGPAAARNTGLKAVSTDFVAFVDSDCVATSYWLDRLLRHFDDPSVALVAPRIVSVGGRRTTWLAIYEHQRSSLDLGQNGAPVVPRGVVSWVPGAALVVRRAAIGDGFDEDMLVGEDVDLVWRLHDAGWSLRYEPSSSVAHDHRTNWPAWATRKVFYGTGGAPLAARHKAKMAPITLTPWSATAWALLFAQRRRTVVVAAMIGLGAVYTVASRISGVRRAHVTAAELVLRGFADSGWHLASAVVRPWWPVAAIASSISARARRVVALAALVDAFGGWREHPRGLDPLRYLIARRVDDAAYGTGLWLGAFRARSIECLLPDIRMHHAPKTFAPTRLRRRRIRSTPSRSARRTQNLTTSSFVVS